MNMKMRMCLPHQLTYTEISHMLKNIAAGQFCRPENNMSLFIIQALAFAATLAILLSTFLPKWILQWRLRHIPIANKMPSEWFDGKAIDRAQTHAMDIMNQAYVKVRFRSTSSS